MTTLGLICPDCGAEVGFSSVNYLGQIVRGCAECGSAWPTSRQIGERVDLAGMERQFSDQNACQVKCRWVPATMDRVELTLGSSGECRVVSLSWLYQTVGRHAADDLYLKGKAEFACSLRVLAFDS